MIRNKNINDADLEVLTSALQNNGTVVELAVGGMSLTDQGAGVLGRMLQYNTTLMSLDLAAGKKSGKAFGPTGGATGCASGFRACIISNLI